MERLDNPFEFARYEAGRAHPIFIPQSLRPFSASNNQFVIGGRGSGKTVLLRSLWWKERTRSGPFEQSPEEFRREQLIGLYARVVDYEVPKFYGLRADTDARDDQRTDLCNRLFVNFLSALQCSLLCDAYAGLAARNWIEFPVEAERRLVETLGLELEPICQEMDYEQRWASFGHMQKFFTRVLEDIHRVGVMAESVRDVNPYLIKSFAEWPSILAVAARQSCSFLEGWRIACCIDEAESLEDWQQPCLNSFIRRRKDPWGYCVAFVKGVYETRKTNIHAQTVDYDDVYIVDLDRMKRSVFREMLDGAVRVRLQECNYTDMNMKNILSDFSVNDLLENALERSEKPVAGELLRAARQHAHEEGATKSMALPIYEEWLTRHDSRLKEYWSLDRGQRRAISSQRVRKKHLSAYHAICRHIGIKPSYAGVQMVLGLSDNCIRDSLRMLYHVWDLATGSAECADRADLPASIEIQRRAIVLAAQNKIGHDLRDSVMPEGLLTLVTNLAQFQQAKITADEWGLMEDMGGFLLPDAEWGGCADVLRAVDEGVYCGVLIKERRSGGLYFRLHNMLSPYYDLPHRRPTRPILISAQEASELLVSHKSGQWKAWFRRAMDGLELIRVGSDEPDS